MATMDPILKKEIKSVIESFELFAEEVLPQSGSIVFDIGNLNDGLLLAKKVKHYLDGLD